jgi:DNA-binding MarR family transcriptional regulator
MPSIPDDMEKYNRCVEDIGDLLQRTVRTCQILERAQIKLQGFSNSQCYILLELLKNKTLTINEISTKMGLEISTITRIMDNLVRDRLIIRQRAVCDKRMVEASLTAAGRQAALNLQVNIRDYYQSVISHLPPGHVREVMNAVELLLAAVEKANQRRL